MAAVKITLAEDCERYAGLRGVVRLAQDAFPRLSDGGRLHVESHYLSVAVVPEFETDGQKRILAAVGPNETPEGAFAQHCAKHVRWRANEAGREVEALEAKLTKARTTQAKLAAQAERLEAYAAHLAPKGGG